jgi:hypothetical protein
LAIWAGDGGAGGTRRFYAAPKGRSEAGPQSLKRTTALASTT